MFVRCSYLSKKLVELLGGFFGFPEDFSFTLDKALVLESMIGDVAESLGTHCPEFIMLF
jgi:hypothetical protein